MFRAWGFKGLGLIGLKGLGLTGKLRGCNQNPVTLHKGAV